MLPPALAVAATLYLALLSGQTLFALSTCAIAAAVGARVTEVRVGAVRVARFEVARVKVTLGLVPGPASAALPGLAPMDPYDGPGCFRRLSLWRRVALFLGPWLVTAALAILCLGHGRAVGSMLHAPGQLLVDLDTAPWWRGLFRVLRAEPLHVALGVVFAKLTAWNLLPLPSFAGGRVVGEIFRRPAREPTPEPPRRLWLDVVAFIVLVVYIGGRFGWGLVRALR